MKNRIKKFLSRGAFFGGFGPLIYGFVMLFLYIEKIADPISGLDLFKGIFSTYILAFIVAGVSIIWEEEKIGLGYAVLIHGTILYLCYLGIYLINGWVKDELLPLLVFSVVFIIGYLLIFVTVYIISKYKAKKLNEIINKK